MFVRHNKISLIMILIIAVNIFKPIIAGQSEKELPVASLTEQLIKAHNYSNINSLSSSAEVKIDPDLLKSSNNTKSKRNPKLSITIPNLPFPGLFPTPTDSSGAPLPTATSTDLDGTNTAGEKFGTSTGLGLASTALLIKSGVLGGLTALKAAIIPPLFVGSMVFFLIAGAVYFTCSVFNCGFGPASTNGSPSLTSFFNRNGYDYYEQQVQPVYQSLEEGYKKFQ